MPSSLCTGKHRDGKGCTHQHGIMEPQPQAIGSPTPRILKGSHQASSGPVKLQGADDHANLLRRFRPETREKAFSFKLKAGGGRRAKTTQYHGCHAQQQTPGKRRRTHTDGTKPALCTRIRVTKKKKNVKFNRQQSAQTGMNRKKKKNANEPSD